MTQFSLSDSPELQSFSLEGKIALVTGASSGIGKYLAGVYARAGAQVVLAARREAAVQAQAETIAAAGGSAIGLRLDVADMASIDAVFDRIDATHGRGPDIVLNCAGIAIVKAFLEQTEEDVDTMLSVNLKGAYFVAQRAARRMVTQGEGTIINVASTAGLRPGGMLTSYGASKAGLIHLTKVMAFELARSNVRVNALCPGNIETDMHKEFEDRGFTDALVKRIPQRRFGQSEDLAGAALLLASDAGRYMTGAVLAVDGGQLVNTL